MMIAASVSFTLVGSSLWRLALVMALDLLFVLVLSNKALVPRSVVVVREKLSQEKVHIRTSLSVLADTAVVSCLLRIV